MVQVYIHTFFQIKVDIKLSQDDQDALRHPQRPRQAQPKQVQQVTIMFHQIGMTHINILFIKDYRFKMVPG